MTDTTTLAQGIEMLLRRDRAGIGTVEIDGFEPLTGGYNQEMLRFTARIDGVEESLVYRGNRPAGQAVVDTDRGIEWRLMRALERDGSVPVPRLLHLDEDGSALGTQAIIMEDLGGSSYLSYLRGPDVGLEREAERFAELAASVHAVDVASLPDEVARPGSWDQYIDSAIDEWRRAETEHAESDPVVRYVAAWLDAHRPPPVPLTVVHADFQPSNVVRTTGDRLVMVDWEIAHVGDPREDLGWAQSLEVLQPPALVGGNLDAFCRRYRERSGLDESQVNPVTLGYFSILSAIKAFRGASEQQRALSEGRASSVRTAFVSGFVPTVHAAWLQATQLIDAAMASQEISA